MNSVENLAILVPLKGFALAKSRLRHGGVDRVDDVARSLALDVLRAAKPRPLFVACETPDVEAFALECGARVIRSPASGLNEVVTHAYRLLGEHYQHLVIAHGDLREPDGLGAFDPLQGVTVVTDDAGSGTNVLALPTRVDFEFHYGPHSASAHQREARRRGLELHVISDSPWRFDVDEPEDLDVTKKI